MDKKFFQEAAKLEDLKSKLLAAVKDSGGLVSQDPEHGLYELDIKIKNYKQFKLSWPFFASPEWVRLQELFRVISDFQSSDILVQENGNKQTVENWKALFHVLHDNSRKGWAITRYKGLGEMDPEQLWDTTMNPEVRTLLKVNIEDAIQADLIFATLMGEEVEPRKIFIVEHALEVKNLDV